MKINLFIIGIVTLVLSTQIHAVEVNQQAPLFSLPTLSQNTPVQLEKFKGKVVYVDFWASWCAPCRTSFPLLNKLHGKLKGQGFEVIAINLDEDKTKAEDFIKEFPVEFNVLRDESGEWADKYVVESMPTSFLIDKQGMVHYIHHGFASNDITEIENKVTQLLAKK